jgi:tetratricopeptide (TPR) repeat protein
MIVLFGLLLCAVPAVAASVEVSSATAISPVAPLIAQGDAAYAKRSDLPEAKIALVYYEKAIAAAPADGAAYWKASRAAWWLGDHAERSSEKLAYFQKGIDWAKATLAPHPDSVEAHFWLGANYGSFGETKGVLKSLFLVKPIRQEMGEVKRLNDHYLSGGAYRVLGVVDYKVPGFAGGSKKRALEELTTALAIDPNDPFTHYYLAEFYKLTGDKEKSAAEVQTLRTLKVPPESQPELEMLQQKANKTFGS